MENWQSEYLQFALFVLATVWLLQKGSPESKELDKAGPSPTRAEGRRARGRGLSHMGAGGRPPHRDLLELADHRHGDDLHRVLVRTVVHGLERFQRGAGDPRRAAVSHGSATWARRPSGRARSRTGSRSSWRSARSRCFAIYLRQRGSPESKPVGAPTGDATGAELVSQDATLAPNRAQLDLAVALAHLERRLRTGCGPAKERAVPQREPRAVAPADDLVARNTATPGERAAAVGAAVVNRMNPVGMPDQKDRGVIDDHARHFSLGQVRRARRFSPVGRAGIEHGLVDADSPGEAQMPAEVPGKARARPPRGS